MSEWSAPADLRAQVLRRWDKGELLAERVVPGPLFPLRLAMRVPSSRDLSDRFEAVRAWAAELQKGAAAGYRLVMREVRHRVIGQNSHPVEAWVDTLDDALRLVAKTREARTFEILLAATAQQQRFFFHGCSVSPCARWRWLTSGRNCWPWWHGYKAIRAPASSYAKWTWPASTASSSKRSVRS